MLWKPRTRRAQSRASYAVTKSSTGIYFDQRNPEGGRQLLLFSFPWKMTLKLVIHTAFEMHEIKLSKHFLFLIPRSSQLSPSCWLSLLPPCYSSLPSEFA